MTCKFVKLHDREDFHDGYVSIQEIEFFDVSTERDDDAYGGFSFFVTALKRGDEDIVYQISPRLKSRKEAEKYLDNLIEMVNK